jgi:hypothetical protein
VLERIGDYEGILEFCYQDSAKAWKWISSNTEINTKIATNDIRDYYLNRSVIHLDSWELKGLYYIKKSDECIKTFCNKGISYLYVNPYTNVILPSCLADISSVNTKLLVSYKSIKIYGLECQGK